MSLQNKGGFCSVTVRSNPKQTSCQTSVFVMQYTFISIRHSVEKGWKYTSGTCQVSHCDLVNKKMLICPQFHCSDHLKKKTSIHYHSAVWRLSCWMGFATVVCCDAIMALFAKDYTIQGHEEVVKLVELLLVPQVWTLHSELSLRGSLEKFYYQSYLTICHVILCHQSVMALSHSTHFFIYLYKHKSWQEPLR